MRNYNTVDPHSVVSNDQLSHSNMIQTQPQRSDTVQLSSINIDSNNQILNNIDPNFIKDLPDWEQKKELIKILLLNLLGSLLQFFLVIGLYKLQMAIADERSIYPLMISIAALYLVGKFGTSKVLRKPSRAIVIYLLLILLTSESLVLFCLIFENSYELSRRGLESALALIAICIQIIMNGIIIIIIIVFVTFGQNRVIKNGLIILVFACLVYILQLSVLLMLNCTFTFLYTMLILNVVNQLSKGKYLLAKGEVFGNANAAYFCIICPFEYE